MKSDEQDAIFQLACALDGDDLEELLTSCEGNAELRKRLEQRRAEENAAGSQSDPESGPSPTSDQDATQVDRRRSAPAPGTFRGESPGAQIGPYKLVEKLGEGGMGVVWRATQEKPVKRTVALKIIKAGMDSAEVIARFEAERQALAMMDHPNIAQVYDAGATESGRPYFVMELVKGTPITRYCDARRMKPEDRLKLFIEVCHGLQHAHLKGVIHRDIKPSNIIVTEHDDKPVPKLIDFGIAKATDQELTERTLYTQAGQMMGTPVYMSPEQASGKLQQVDTRTDVYALGVLLYELLTGSTPIDAKKLKEAGYIEMQRMVAETDPPRPSVRLTSLADGLDKVAEGRGINPPAKLGRLIRGDLDWIVMRALEKEPDRRYVTVRGFALDIERHLHSEPVEATPPSATYRLGKFMKRNRSWVRAAATVMVVILAAVAVDLMGQAKRKRERAANLFSSLFDTRADRLPSVVEEVRRHQRYLDERLRNEAENGQELRNRARAHLVLLPGEKERMSEIAPWLLAADPDELAAFMQLLGSYKNELKTEAKAILVDGNALPRARLRAAAIYVEVDPSSREFDGWSEDISTWLVGQSPFKAEQWVRLFEPIKGTLTKPLQAKFALNRHTAAGEIAALALAIFHEDDLKKLIALARNASAPQLNPIANVLGNQPGRAKPALIAELTSATLPPTERARLAMVLLQMNEPKPVWPLLGHDPQPDLRTTLIHSFAEYNPDWQILTQRLESETDPGILSAIILALGDYLAHISRPERNRIRTNHLEKLYAAHPDPGVRSAAQWLISQWLKAEWSAKADAEKPSEEAVAEKIEEHLAGLDRANRTGKQLGSRNWFATLNGDFTMAVVRGPVTFMMGSPDEEEDRKENEERHEETIQHSFALATTEVSRELYEQFLDGNPDVQNQLSVAQQATLSANRDKYGPGAAITFTNLWEASLFCLWFSRQEGIPPQEHCYDYDPVTKLLRTREGWLQRQGYRLPTEAEWEYACRAGTQTPRFFGSNADYLVNYAWCITDQSMLRSHRPALLRPNPLGLFDILGNGAEQCQEFYAEPYRSDPRGMSFEIPNNFDQTRPAALRGGSFAHLPNYARSAWRGRSLQRILFGSIRLAVTVKDE